MQNSNTEHGAACDTHIHVFGARQRYPIHDESRYTWYDSPLEAHAPFARAAGIGRIVIVQPSIYGTDNRCTLDAAQALGGRGRAVVELDEHSVSDAELDAMHAQGARGARLSVTLSQPVDAAVLAHTQVRIGDITARIARLGWHIEVLSPGWLSAAMLPALQDCGLDYCFAHLAGLKPAQPSAAAEFAQLLEVMADPRQRCFMKLSAFYRSSSVPDYQDLMPMVHQLVARAPQRLFFGTDFPHPKFNDRVVPRSQLDMLYRCVQDAALRRQILVDNPVAFYGFA